MPCVKKASPRCGSQES
jgi:hypothetical protein